MGSTDQLLGCGGAKIHSGGRPSALQGREGDNAGPKLGVEGKEVNKGGLGLAWSPSVSAGVEGDKPEPIGDSQVLLWPPEAPGLRTESMRRALSDKGGSCYPLRGHGRRGIPPAFYHGQLRPLESPSSQQSQVPLAGHCWGGWREGSSNPMGLPGRPREGPEPPSGPCWVWGANRPQMGPGWSRERPPAPCEWSLREVHRWATQEAEAYP